jgi:hypothetical protein
MGAHLDGALYDDDTNWPESFDYRAAALATAARYTATSADPSGRSEGSS